MTTSDSTVLALHARLRKEHDEVNAVLERLIEAFETGEHDLARTVFREFDARLTAHFALEEELLLPEFSHLDSDEAAKIADEHQAIRTRMDELLIGSDLHATRLPAIRQLADDLRAHALHEEQSLYRWVDQSFADSPIPTRLEPTPAAPPH